MYARPITVTGQVSIPKEIRNELGLTAPGEVVFYKSNGMWCLSRRDQFSLIIDQLHVEEETPYITKE